VRASKLVAPFPARLRTRGAGVGPEPVDYAVIVAEPTADALLRAVYVKGGDYSEANLPEAPAARAVGAPERSSSKLARARGLVGLLTDRSRF
jgi:hypothetical protein